MIPQDTSTQAPSPTAAMRDIHAMERLSRAFESSAKRWELIVYPSLFAFIILASYGFYLVYSLAQDVHYLSRSVDKNMTTLAGNMQTVSNTMESLNQEVSNMSGHVYVIAKRVSTLEPILTNMDSMNRSMQSMTYTTHNIRNDMAYMNDNVTRPMSFMNRILPW